MRLKKICRIESYPNRTKYDYCEEITSQIAKDSVYNIALEGDYGTGKSSIIKKLVSSYKKNRVKTISFLSFNLKKLTRRKDEGALDDNGIKEKENKKNVADLEVITKEKKEINLEFVPTLFINGEKFSMDITAEEFESKIEELLKDN